jgi:hypothetical protein
MAAPLPEKPDPLPKPWFVELLGNPVMNGFSAIASVVLAIVAIGYTHKSWKREEQAFELRNSPRLAPEGPPRLVNRHPTIPNRRAAFQVNVRNYSEQPAKNVTFAVRISLLGVERGIMFVGPHPFIAAGESVPIFVELADHLLASVDQGHSTELDLTVRYEAVGGVLGWFQSTCRISISEVGELRRVNFGAFGLNHVKDRERPNDREEVLSGFGRRP